MWNWRPWITFCVSLNMIWGTLAEFPQFALILIYLWDVIRITQPAEGRDTRVIASFDVKCEAKDFGLLSVFLHMICGYWKYVNQISIIHTYTNEKIPKVWDPERLLYWCPFLISMQPKLSTVIVNSKFPFTAQTHSVVLVWQSTMSIFKCFLVVKIMLKSCYPGKCQSRSKTWLQKTSMWLPTTAYSKINLQELTSNLRQNKHKLYKIKSQIKGICYKCNL